MNKANITIVGALERPPELKYLGGNAVLNMSVGVLKSKKDGDGNWARDFVQWYRVTVWGKLAEAINQWDLKEGQGVEVTGTWPRVREYKRQDGAAAYSLEFTAQLVEPVDIKGNRTRQAESTMSEAEDLRF